MAKVTKSVLKGIVKECLVEILSEGIDSNSISLDNSKISGTARKRKSKKSINRRPALDKISFNTAINDATTTMTNDPVMSAIFADTARTTLQEQYGAESGNNSPTRMKPIDEASKKVANSNPEDLFENAGNWANLAFADKKSQ